MLDREQSAKKHALLVIACGVLVLCFGLAGIAGLLYLASSDPSFRLGQGLGRQSLTVAMFVSVIGVVMIIGGKNQRRSGQRSKKLAIVVMVLVVALVSSVFL